MRYSLRYQILLFILFLLTLGISGLARSDDVIHLGVTVSKTGKYAELGAMNEKAYRLWERDVNRRGGLLGRQIKITMLDDKSEAELASNLYRRLIVGDKVDLVLGPYSSDITEAVSNITEQHHMPLLASGASADTIWQQGRSYVFGVYVTSSKYSVGFLELLVKSEINRIAIVAADDSFSQSISSGTAEWAKRYELQMVYSATFKKGSTDIRSSIQAARLAGAEALIVAGHFDDAVNGRRALKEIAWTPKAYYATVGPAIQKFADTLKEDADYTYSTSQWEPTLPYPGGREFTQSFREEYGILPSYHAASAYASGQILEAAIRKTKSLDREKLRHALSKLDVITVMGRYGVDENGKQIRHFTTTVQWQKGKKEVVAPQELITAKPAWR